MTLQRRWTYDIYNNPSLTSAPTWQKVAIPDGSSSYASVIERSGNQAGSQHLKKDQIDNFIFQTCIIGNKKRAIRNFILSCLPFSFKSQNLHFRVKQFQTKAHIVYIYKCMIQSTFLQFLTSILYGLFSISQKFISKSYT